MPRRVTALVPNYNGRELLATVIGSLLAQTYPDLEIVVVDDGSTDGSAALVEATWSGRVRVLHSHHHPRGFASTVNRGLVATESEYVALINSDVELAPRWVATLVATLDADPSAASATGKTLMADDRGRIDGAGNMMRWSGAAERRGHGEPDAGQYDEPGPVISACAGYALYRRSALAEVGAFDEAFGAYYEDVDWGLRAQLQGFGCRYEPAAVAYHVGGATYGESPRLVRLQRRNQLQMIARSYPGSVLVRRAPQILAGQAILLYRAWRTGGLAPYLLGVLDAALALPSALRARRTRPAALPGTATGIAPLMASERSALRSLRR